MAVTLMNDLDLPFKVKSSKRSNKLNVVKCAETVRKQVSNDLYLPFQGKKGPQI